MSRLFEWDILLLQFFIGHILNWDFLLQCYQFFLDLVGNLLFFLNFLFPNLSFFVQQLFMFILHGDFDFICNFFIFGGIAFGFLEFLFHLGNFLFELTRPVILQKLPSLNHIDIFGEISHLRGYLNFPLLFNLVDLWQDFFNQLIGIAFQEFVLLR